MTKFKTLKFTILMVACLLITVSTVADSEYILLKNGNILTVTGDNIEGGDILIKGKLIVKIGKGIKPPKGARVIDLDGKYAMPGIIDTHIHIAAEGNVNETGVLMPTEVHVKDVINPEDYTIFHALAAGVTTIHTMHGSANPIAGRGIVLKLRWGQDADGMIFKEAPETIKWALGENPKQSNYSTTKGKRYPGTRMGVEASIRELFEEAKDYDSKWDEYRAALKKGKRPLPPRKNYRLEIVNEMLDGKLWVRCHAYQADEMISIMKLCDEYGVKLAAFEHALEAYRIIPELKKYNVAISGFVDFWGYKWETFKTMPYEFAQLAKNGIVTAVHSDSGTRTRRLYIDAAKMIRYGGATEKQALEALTINGAKILGVEKLTGSLEAGKQADIAVFNRHPLDPYTRPEMTIVEGKILFDRKAYFAKRAEEEKERKRREAEEKAKKEAEKKKKEAKKKTDKKPAKAKKDKPGVN